MTTQNHRKTTRMFDFRPALLALTALCACDDELSLEDETPETPAHHDGHAEDLDLFGSDAPTAESISCTTFTDTGYVEGTPFQISLVTVDGEPVQIDAANAFYVMQQAA